MLEFMPTFRFLSVLTLCLSLGWAQQIGDPAPDFRLVNEAGEVVQLSDFLGAPVVLNVWASWCAPCVEELPYFQELYDEHGANGEAFQFLLMNNNEAADEASAFLRNELGVTLPAVFDADSELREREDLDKTLDILKNYRVRGMPSTYFIDAQGKIAAIKAGFLLPDEAPILFDSIGVNLP